MNRFSCCWASSALSSWACVMWPRSSRSCPIGAMAANAAGCMVAANGVLTLELLDLRILAIMLPCR